jgi:hypothetical protein
MMVTVMDYLISSQEMQHDTDAMAEGEKNTSYMNKQNQDFYNKNPNFKRDDREVKFVGNQLASIVTPTNKPGQVAKKPMTPFKTQGVAEGDSPKVTTDQLKKMLTHPALTDKDKRLILQRLAATKPKQGVAEGKIDFAKKLQKNVDKHNKAVVKTKQDIGSRIADIGAGGKEYNVKTDAAWDAAKKKVAEGSVPKEKQKTSYRDINGPEYKAAADKQKEKMAKDKEAEPGKKLADKINKKN